MEDPTAHLSTDLGKAIWYLRNSIQLFCLQHDYLEHAANVAIDKRIQENIEKSKTGEKPDMSVREVDELQAYKDEFCDELRGALSKGFDHGQDMPSCKRFIQSIELRHVVGVVPDFKTFIFDALVELETLLVAVERLGASSAEEAKDVKPFHASDRESGKPDLQMNQGVKDVLKTFVGLPKEDQCDISLQLFLEDTPEADAKSMMTHLGIGHKRLSDLPTYQKRLAKESRSAVNLRDSDGVFSNNN